MFPVAESESLEKSEGRRDRHLAASEDYCWYSWPRQAEADERHHNPTGTLQGGVSCDLADAAMGYAYAATLGEGETFTTVELKINFLRAVRRAPLTAEARVVNAGSTLGYVECEVKDQTGKLVAKAASTCLKLRQDRKETP